MPLVWSGGAVRPERATATARLASFRPNYSVVVEKTTRRGQVGGVGGRRAGDHPLKDQ